MADLTFHPSRDDPAALKAFLKSICQDYEDRKHTKSLLGVDVGSSRKATPMPAAQSAEETATPQGNPTSNQVVKPNTNTIQSQNIAYIKQAQAEAQATASPFKAPDGLQVKEAPQASNPPALSTSPRKRAPVTTSKTHACPKRAKLVKLSTATRSSLLKAKQIDTRAPDPELVAPPNETEDARRRRLERINGRRKRTKKLIEIDQLNEQVVDLSQWNKELRRTNHDLRQARDALKRALLQGDATAKEATAAAAAAALGLPADPTTVTTDTSTEVTEGDDRIPSNTPQKQQPQHPQHSEQQQQVPASLLSIQQPPPGQPRFHPPRPLPPQPHRGGQPPVSYQDLLRSLHPQSIPFLPPTTNQEQHHHKPDDHLARRARPAPPLWNTQQLQLALGGVYSPPPRALRGGPESRLWLQHQRHTMQDRLRAMGSRAPHPYSVLLHDQSGNLREVRQPPSSSHPSSCPRPEHQQR